MALYELDLEEMTKAAGGTFTDEMRICKGCGESFWVSAGELEYHADHGTTVEYCSECRDAEKRKTPSYIVYETACAGCGEILRVPFRPQAGQEIYCSECFSH